MTYLRRYALSAMLGIVTEDDTDGELTGKRPKTSPPQRMAPNAPQRQNPPQHESTQGQQPKNVSESTPERGHFANLPKIDGISYQSVPAQDGRLCIVASGQTQPKKELLMGAGFKWNAQRKMWWKYADAS